MQSLRGKTAAAYIDVKDSIGYFLFIRKNLSKVMTSVIVSI